MKKYNVYNLYVLEMQNSNDLYYLICKHNILKDAYVEIFTNEEIKNSNDSFVEPLSDYYSALEQCDYFTGNPLMLTKKDLLRKFISINADANLQKGKALSQNCNSIIGETGILQKATLNFFPKNGKWYGDCFKRPKDLSMVNLPCHLRDDLWLARMMKRDQKLLFISTNKIFNFIRTSSLFQERRHKYEQEIVKWQIDWMRSGGENWIIDEDYGGDFTFLSSVCDLGFRKGVVDTLSKIGMNIDAIEEGLEKNADSWREVLMSRAFSNKYEPLYLNLNYNDLFDDNNDSKEDRIILEPADKEFKEKWLKLRRYEYYQNHKDSVDKYGVVENDMLLSDEEVENFRVYLEQKHNERMERIEQFKQEKDENIGQQRLLRNMR